MNEHQIFFERLLVETAKAYQASEIKSKNLFYSIAATPIFQKGTMIVGFNWGAGHGQSYKAQTEMETKPFTQLDIGSLKRTFKYFKEYLPEEKLDTFVQSNLCFFRSKKEGEISLEDIRLTKELFDSFIEYINPAKIVSFSAQLKEYFSNQNKLSDVNTITISSGTKRFCATNATLKFKWASSPIHFLPHPNYPITNEARHEAWKFCFGKII